MQAKLGSERAAVQNTLISYAKQVGWQYVKREEALSWRGGETGLIFRDIFVDQMLKLNSEFINEEMIEDLIKRLERLPARIEGNLQAWEYLCGLKTIFVPSEKRERNVKFIDEDVEKNVFHVTDEFEFTNGKYTNRYDVVFLINGIPVFFVETKSVAKFFGRAISRESIISKALDQVRRYHRETPEAMTLFQLFTVTNIIHFLYAATWFTSTKDIFNWKEESAQNIYEKLVKTFFDRKRLINILLHFILFTRQDDELKKVVLRPHQMRAVKKITERAEQKTKRRGLIWHTQGSGKTYTMIVAAKEILENPLFENPTVIMVVDRNELESQLFGNLRSVGFEIDENRIAGSKNDLRELLQRDTRGLIVTTIYKFGEMPANVNMRKNIFVLVDEAHRTTGRDLGNYLMGALPNATYIGFTGTPIDKTVHGKGTFKIFGIDDPKGYLDKYSIVESIEDGTTVKLYYTLAPNELRPEKEILEKEFLSLAEAEGISDMEILNKVLEKAVCLKNMLKNRERIKKIANFVKEHFTEYVEPMGYKAFLVAVDREACALYKKELDKVFPKEYSEVIISPAQNDPPELTKYHYSKEKEKRIRKAFRKAGELPKILIVTEKLLTGFDAPILYCMYLDKPMRDHVLLQAIARVNRPYEDKYGRKKPSGFVLDFVGIFDKLKKALAFDSGDIKGIEKVIKDIKVLKERFKELMKTAKKEYLSLMKGKKEDKAVEAILEHFRDEKKRHSYYEFYEELADIYEILSPDAFLRPYLEDYDTLTRIYKILKEVDEPGLLIDREFTRKTAKLIQKYTKTKKIKLTLDVYEINEHTLKKLEESNASNTEKVFNLLKSIKIAVEQEKKRNPYLISIGEKAYLISIMYRERQKTTKETLNELKKLIEEINDAKKEQVKKKMSSEAFSVYWILKNENISNSEDIAKDIHNALENYCHWRTSEEQERKVKQEIYKILGKGELDAKKFPEIVKKILDTLREAEK